MREIFSYNQDINKNAYINWQVQINNSIDNLVMIASGFKLAAEKLMDNILENNVSKGADILVFPIMFSINQSIELYLKAILLEMENLTTKKLSDFNTHDIRGLFEKLIIENTEEGLLNHVHSLKEYIDELYSYIAPTNKKPELDFTRYPFDTRKKPYFYILATENVVINIENLAECYAEIMESLSSLYFMYQEELERKNGTITL